MDSKGSSNTEWEGRRRISQLSIFFSLLKNQSRRNKDCKNFISHFLALQEGTSANIYHLLQ